MKTKTFTLSHGFQLIAHHRCSLFVDTEDPDLYIITDWDRDPMCTLLVGEERVECKNSRYDFHHTLNIMDNTIMVHLIPDEEGEDGPMH